MKIKKAALSLLTAMVCASSTFTGEISLTVGAELYSEELTYGDLTYYTIDEDEDGTYDCVEITDCDESATEVVIPEEIDGILVKSIGGHAFRDCTSLLSIEVSENNKYYSDIDGVLFNKDKTELCQYPAGKTEIEYIIPDSVTSIGYYAFEDCTSLTSIIIPDSVTSIEDHAFEGTALLDNQNGVKYADRWVVDCDEDVTEVVINEGTIGIADCAFAGCTSLTSITIPDSVTKIEDGVFFGCKSLTSITIPDGVEYIGDHAFESCALTSVMLPKSVRTIGDWAFTYCPLTKITIKNPDCNIIDSSGLENADIYGYEGSTAQAYAEEYGNDFFVIGSEPEQPEGDVDGNGKTDLYDLIRLCRSIVNAVTLTDDEMKIADMDGNGIVDVYDAIKLARIIAAQ